MAEQRPAWLVGMENASIAEARTRAFLLDRFWVLERSVDIEGADLFIQRRLTQRNLLDRQPLRLGIVQVKFFSTEKTTQAVHKEYVTNEDGTPRGEFFLMCHTGYGSKARAFLLTAQDVVDGFEVAPEGHARSGEFVLPGSSVLHSSRFEVVMPELVLDRLENALYAVDFDRNRRFMAWALPSARISRDDIESLYREPLDNWWGDIPDAFYRMRKKAESALLGDLEEVRGALEEIASATDPAKALDLAEWLHHEHRDHVRIPEDLYDEEFHRIVLQHRGRVTALRETGLLDLFLALRSEFVDFICRDLGSRMPMPGDIAYVVDVSYNPDGLQGLSFSSATHSVAGLWSDKPAGEWWLLPDAPDMKGTLSSVPGRVRVFWLPGRYGHHEFRHGKWHEIPIQDWQQWLREYGIIPAGALMDEVYRHRFGD